MSLRSTAWFEDKVGIIVIILFLCRVGGMGCTWRLKIGVWNPAPSFSGLFLETGSLSLNSELISSARLVGQHAPGPSHLQLSLALELQANTVLSDCLHGCWGSDLKCSCFYRKQFTNGDFSAPSWGLFDGYYVERRLFRVSF